ncbi:MAG TPA: hypothetical protein DCZ94_08350 [Lentisphaeria bacterium]|nr:MAG: hypothetical protein A2X48_19830 [Lentisphaerae bacterium GWF2_49_21]HBC86948.1 hypothetical protein [Lentisphaeria bacterium]
MNKTLATILLLVVLFFPFSLHAQEQAPAQPVASETKPKDYGAGFEKFYKLGLPDVANGKYVYLSWGLIEDYDESPGRNGIKYSSNWLVKENKKGLSTFIVSGCYKVDVYDSDYLKEIKEEESLEKKSLGMGGPDVSEDDDRRGAKWKDADLKKDIDKILLYMDLRKNDKYSPIEKYEWGHLLIFAIHAYRIGYKDDANRLAHALFNLTSPTPQEVVTEAIGVIAEVSYEEDLLKLYENGSWVEFSKKLDTFLSNFTSGWRGLPAVRSLAEKARKMASYASIPEIEGKDITDEDRQLALELAGFGLKGVDKNEVDENSFKSLHRELWLLPEGEKVKGSGGRQENVIDRIKKRGMKSIPLLLALLKDDYLLKADILYLKGPMDFEREMLYGTLRRPISRQDLALCLLEPLLNLSDIYESLKEDRQVLFKRFSDWYDEHKNETPVQLARFYLAEGDYSFHQEKAMYYLIKNGKEEDFKYVEKYLLGADPVICLNLAKEYFLARGGNARGFAGKMLEKLNDNPDENDKSIRTAITIFRDYQLSAKEIIGEMVSGKRPFEGSNELLSIKLKEEKPEDVLGMLLNAAITAKDSDLSAKFIEFISFGMGGYFYEGYNTPSGGRLPPIKGTLELWKKLLADTRPLDGQKLESYLESKVGTVGEMTALILEMLYGNYYETASGCGLNDMQSYMAIILGKDTIRNITRARIEKILEGVKAEELPKYPNAANVSNARKKTIIEQVEKAKDDDIAKLISSLTDEEKLVIYYEEDNRPEVDNLFTRFWKVANNVSNLESEVPEWNDLKGLDIGGRPFDKATCEKLLEISRKLALEGKAAKIEVKRKPFFGGVTIRMSRIVEDLKAMASKDGKEDEIEHPYDKGVVSGVIAFCHFMDFCLDWPLKDKKQELGKTDEDDEENDPMLKIRKEFWVRVEEFCNGKKDILGSAYIEFKGWPPKMKIQIQEQDSLKR